MLESKSFTNWKQQVNTISNKCCPSTDTNQTTCKYQPICKGGCFNRRYVQKRRWISSIFVMQGLP